MSTTEDRALYELKRAAYEPDHHLDLTASNKSVNRLLRDGLAVEHGRTPEEHCGCAWYVLTDAGLALAAEYGITRTWADEALAAESVNA